VQKEATLSGIHHVTAISGKAPRNLNFYTHGLGLRFVKKTANFDDPGTYHLYYGDSSCEQLRMLHLSEVLLHLAAR
jgi:catechol 2,3-dioxygenase-like lactoylglutathione lyase family enzyme